MADWKITRVWYVHGARTGPDAIDRATPGRHVEVSAVKMPLSQPDGETSTTT